MVTEELSRAERDRKLRAKKFNEHIKLFVNSVNALGLIVIGAGFVQPAVTGWMQGDRDTSSGVFWIMLGVALHFIAQACLRLLRAE